jgi:hypothetical protein
MTASLVLGPVPDARLGRINPVAQLVATGVVTLVLLISLDVVTPAVVVAAELCLLPAAGLTDPLVLWRRTWPLLLGATSVGVVNVVLSDDATPVTGVGLALRVVGLALPGVLLVASTDPVRLADALTIHWRVSTRFAFGSLAALRPGWWPGSPSPCSSAPSAAAPGWPRRWTPAASTPGSLARTPAARTCTGVTPCSSRPPSWSARAPSP